MQSFSDDLESWLKSKQTKTLASLIAVSKDKSFAIIILFLMLLPALPIPTGGITHVTELITMLLALEMIAGRSEIWLPKRWKHIKLGKLVQGKALPMLLGRIRWLERHSTPRGQAFFGWPLINRWIGFGILVLTIFTFISPPFSGLDTLPALGAVILCLALILDDALFLLLGALVGLVGSVLVVALGGAVFAGVYRLL